MMRFEKVNKDYGEFDVVKEIKVDIEKGEVVVMIGG